MGPEITLCQAVQRLEESGRTHSHEDKLRARILAWERRTQRVWNDDQSTFAQLAEKYQLPLKDLFPTTRFSAFCVASMRGESFTLRTSDRVGRQDDLALVVRHETVSSSTVSPPE